MKLHPFKYLTFMLVSFAATATPQKTFLLLDSNKLDQAIGVTQVIDEKGNTYRRRHLEGVVDYVTEHTNDEHHGDGEDYPLWREYLRRPHPSIQTLRYFFDQAAQEFGVPIAILEAIAQVETNWTQMGPSIDRGWGIMHLVQNNYADTLGEAAALLDIEPQVLKDDAEQNIRGAAALLAHYAGEQRHHFTQLEEWFEAVKQLSGLVNDDLREMQAVRYYQIMKRGSESHTLWGETLILDSHANISLTQTEIRRARRNLRSTDYAPAISNLTSCNYSSRSSTIDTWVNHWIGTGTYAGAISWFHNCRARVSAHFVVRASDGEITQVVRVKKKAWHAGVRSYNDRSIGVEHEVTAANPDTWTTEMLKASANMAHYFTDKYGIPRTRSTTPGILGHNEIKTTDCPGTFPWETWMKYLNRTDIDVKLHSSVTIEPYPIVQGSPVTVTVNIANEGTNDFVGNFAAALHSSTGEFLGDIERKDHLQLGAGSNEAYTFHQSTIVSEPAHYQLQVKYESPSAGIAWAVIPNGEYTNPLDVEIVPDETTVEPPHVEPDPDIEYVWHGNGSIISYHGRLLPKKNAGIDWPYGITKDVVQLHQSSDKPVGFFQWQINEVGCRQLRIDAPFLSPEEKKVHLTMGQWDTRDSDVTFSNVTLPFVLGEANTPFSLFNGDWFMVKVAFLSPLNQKTRLGAICTEYYPTVATYTLGGGSATVMADGYIWHGNASIISHLFRNLSDQSVDSIDWAYGVFRDVTVIAPSEKPMVFFQWQMDAICPQLVLDAPDLISGDSQRQVDVYVKEWKVPNNEAKIYSNQILPVTIDSSRPKEGRWNVIQIKFRNAISQMTQVQATCLGFE